MGLSSKTHFRATPVPLPAALALPWTVASSPHLVPCSPCHAHPAHSAKHGQRSSSDYKPGPVLSCPCGSPSGGPHTLRMQPKFPSVVGEAPCGPALHGSQTVCHHEPVHHALRWGSPKSRPETRIGVQRAHLRRSQEVLRGSGKNGREYINKWLTSVDNRGAAY